MRVPFVFLPLPLFLIDCPPPPCTQTSCAFGTVCTADGTCQPPGDPLPPLEGEGEGGTGEGEGEGEGTFVGHAALCGGAGIAFDPDEVYLYGTLREGSGGL